MDGLPSGAFASAIYFIAKAWVGSPHRPLLLSRVSSEIPLPIAFQSGPLHPCTALGFLTAPNSQTALLLCICSMSPSVRAVAPQAEGLSLSLRQQFICLVFKLCP